MDLDGNELDKARLVKIVLSNPILKHRTIEFSYEKPFDVLLENVREKNWWRRREFNPCLKRNYTAQNAKNQYGGERLINGANSAVRTTPRWQRPIFSTRLISWISCQLSPKTLPNGEEASRVWEEPRRYKAALDEDHKTCITLGRNEIRLYLTHKAESVLSCRRTLD